MTMAMAAVGDLVAPRERGRYQGYIAATFAVATIVGPLLGGVLVDHASWRWVFLVNLPIGAAALAALHLRLPAPEAARRRPPARRGGRRAAGRRDHRADADLHLGRGALRVGLGGDPRRSSPRPSSSSGALVVRERRAADPIVPFHLLRTRPVAIASAALFLATAALFSVTVFVPLFLETTTGASPTDAGLLLVPAMLGIAVSTTLSGRAIVRTGRYKRFPIAGLALMTVALVAARRLRGRPLAGRHRDRARRVRPGLRHGHPGPRRGRAEQRRSARARRRDRHDRLLPRARRGRRRRRPRRGLRGAGRRARRARMRCAPTSSTASRPSSWSPPRSPRWRSSSSCACPSCPCRPPTASRKEDQMASAFTTAVALRGEQSGGAISVIENTLPARWDGPPLHHHEFDETFYVLDGELTFQLATSSSPPGRGAGLRARRRRAHPREPRRRSRALPAALHAGGLRGLLRPARGAGGGRGPAAVGAGADAAGHHRRRADRRARRPRARRRRSRPPPGGSTSSCAASRAMAGSR